MKTELILLTAALAAGCAHSPSLTAHDERLTAEDRARLGASDELQGQLDDAQKQYEAAVVKNPSCVEGWLALGDIAFQKGKWNQAEHDYRRALKTQPFYPGACNNLALIDLARDRNLKEAERLLRGALQRPGPAPYVLDTLVLLYLKEKRYSAALSALDEAENMVPATDELLRKRLMDMRQRVYDSMPQNSPEALEGR